MSISRKEYFIFSFLLIMLFPLFPPVFFGGEYHINVLSLLVCIGGLVSFRVTLKKKLLAFPLMYFLVFQILLFLSYFIGEEGHNGFGDVLSLIRPLLLLFITLSVMSLFTNYTDFYFAIYKSFTILVPICFIYSFIEVFLSSYTVSFLELLYRNPGLKFIDGVSVTFFTLPYFQSYILSIGILFFLSHHRFTRHRFDLYYIFMAIIPILLSQSKVGLFIIFFSISLYWFLTVPLKKKVFVAGVLILFISAIAWFLLDFFIFLKGYISGNLVETATVLLDKPEQSATLMERFRQVGDTHNKIIDNNLFFGVGLAKGVLLESWVASILYRYGYLGISFFSVVYVSIFLYSITQIKHNVTEKLALVKSECFKVISIWSISVFITQISTFMLEVTKAGFITCVMIAFFSSLNSKKSNINETK